MAQRRIALPGGGHMGMAEFRFEGEQLFEFLFPAPLVFRFRRRPAGFVAFGKNAQGIQPPERLGRELPGQLELELFRQPATQAVRRGIGRHIAMPVRAAKEPQNLEHPLPRFGGGAGRFHGWISAILRPNFFRVNCRLHFKFQVSAFRFPPSVFLLRLLRIFAASHGPCGPPLTKFPFRRNMPGMTAASDSFADWACNPRRTLEERFGAELLIEHTLGLWRQKHGLKVEANYEAERLRLKERSLDPAHQPAYSRTDAEHAAEVLPELKQFSLSFSDDRPLRDLSFLRFCPPLETIELRKTEIRDWSPFQFQTALTTLHVWGDKVVRDLRVLGRLTRLKSARLYFGTPWPDLRGLENLGELRELHFHGNILAFCDIPRLPQLRHLEVHHGCGHAIPIRRVADLPEMPELRRLHLENTTELHGLGRYPKLLNLVVYGCPACHGREAGASPL